MLQQIEIHQTFSLHVIIAHTEIRMPQHPEYDKTHNSITYK